MISVTESHKTMPVIMFENLKNFLKPVDCTIENIGFESKYGPFEIKFHAVQEDNYELVIEDYGYQQKNKWVQLKTTPNQLMTMEDYIIKELNNLQMLEDEKEVMRLEQKAFEIDCEKYNEVGF